MRPLAQNTMVGRFKAHFRNLVQFRNFIAFTLIIENTFGICLFVYLLNIDTWEVSDHSEAEFYGQIPIDKGLERKHSRHELDVLYRNEEC